MVLLHAAHCAAAVTASGRHWQITLESLECGPQSLVIGARLRYLGPKGTVEAPLVRLVDEKGRRHPAKSLAWKHGDKAHAAWLARGGLANLQSEDVGGMLLRFEAGGGSLGLELGDIPAFALTRNGACLAPGQIQAPRAVRAKGKPTRFPVHRARYPCGPDGKLIAAEYPPYLPRQLLVYGRGYLPNVRDIDLPMGSAPAQPYVFPGARGDDLIAVEDAARRALAADFPGLAGPNYFAFNWGLQVAQSGNQVYSIGLYELRACPK